MRMTMSLPMRWKPYSRMVQVQPAPFFSIRKRL
jgi:hypothetical protein